MRHARRPRLDGPRVEVESSGAVGRFLTMIIALGVDLCIARPESIGGVTL